uniref:Uncharacterized protein n=1 Tax=Branchiostoma floridae TaxID=7739 RepID=C3YF61_BRAFL|eukprot:XP_002605053.1 hypothetical protein BRAFLDRAFT_85199 [Branchiostoma floridae]
MDVRQLLAHGGDASSLSEVELGRLQKQYEKLRREWARKRRKLEKLDRAAKAKQHVRQRLQDQSCETGGAVDTASPSQQPYSSRDGDQEKVSVCEGKSDHPRGEDLTGADLQSRKSVSFSLDVLSSSKNIHQESLSTVLTPKESTVESNLAVPSKTDSPRVCSHLKELGQEKKQSVFPCLSPLVHKKCTEEVLDFSLVGQEFVKLKLSKVKSSPRPAAATSGSGHGKHRQQKCKAKVHLPASGTRSENSLNEKGYESADVGNDKQNMCKIAEADFMAKSFLHKDKNEGLDSGKLLEHVDTHNQQLLAETNVRRNRKQRWSKEVERDKCAILGPDAESEVTPSPDPGSGPKEVKLMSEMKTSLDITLTNKVESQSAGIKNCKSSLHTADVTTSEKSNVCNSEPHESQSPADDKGGEGGTKATAPSSHSKESVSSSGTQEIKGSGVEITCVGADSASLTPAQDSHEKALQGTGVEETEEDVATSLPQFSACLQFCSLLPLSPSTAACTPCLLSLVLQPAPPVSLPQYCSLHPLSPSPSTAACTTCLLSPECECKLRPAAGTVHKHRLRIYAADLVLSKLQWMREQHIWPNGLRYLWTDAHGVCLLVSLYKELQEEKYLKVKPEYHERAVKLAKDVHHAFYVPGVGIRWKMLEDLSGPYPGYGLGGLDFYDGFVTYRLLDPAALSAEIVNMQQLVYKNYKGFSCTQDLGLGECLWMSHFFPDEEWAKTLRQRSEVTLDSMWVQARDGRGYFCRHPAARNTVFGFTNFGVSYGLQSVGLWPDRVSQLHAFFDTYKSKPSYKSGDDYDTKSITHVMHCNSLFPGVMLT